LLKTFIGSHANPNSLSIVTKRSNENVQLQSRTRKSRSIVSNVIEFSAAASIEPLGLYACMREAAIESINRQI